MVASEGKTKSLHQGNQWRRMRQQGSRAWHKWGQRRQVATRACSPRCARGRMQHMGGLYSNVTVSRQQVRAHILSKMVTLGMTSSWVIISYLPDWPGSGSQDTTACRGDVWNTSG